MRSLWIRGALAAVVLSAGVPAQAAADTIVGQLVDSACNMMMIKRELVLAPDHLKCAVACAQKGGRLAVLTDKGEVYVVTGALTQDDNAKLVRFINQNVVLTGTLGVIQPVSAILPTTKVATTKPRRPSGTEDGVVSKTIRQGDFRDGDVTTGSELSIEVLTIDLVTTLIKPITPDE